MIYGAILAILLGGLAYIQYLKNTIQKHETENAALKSQAKTKEWDDQINNSKIKITEDEKDFKDAETDFKTKYGTGDTQPKSDGKS